MACLETAKTDLLKDFPKELQGKIIEFSVKRERNGYKDARTIVYALRSLQRSGADLLNPESVKEVLRGLTIQESTKHTYASAYDAFLKFLGGTWEKPRYAVSEKAPFIPAEKELETLIAGFTPKLSAFCQLLKETGARYGEVAQIRWTDVDFERKTVAINHPEKHGKTRILGISDKAVNMINRLPKTGQTLFGEKLLVKSAYYRQRKKISFKLNEPRLLKISLHTFRHWVGTMHYHNVKSIVHVQQKLGHRSITSTMRYITIEESLFQEAPEDFYSATAKTVPEACKLVEAGFEYVCDFDGMKVFRKRK